LVDTVGVEDRLARLCRRYASSEVDDYIVRAGGTDILTRIRAAVTAGTAGDALVEDLDALDDAVAAVDLDGLTTPVRVFPRVPGQGDGHPVLYACPHRVCNRIEPPALNEPSPDAQRCTMSGAPLRRLQA
jgi:hypothetical protein